MSWTRCTTQAYFNPHSPYGERPRRPSRTVRMRYFNPRSPCGERQQHKKARYHRHSKFQSTLPVWGATGKTAHPTMRGLISIHAPRVGSDLRSDRKSLLPRYFNPRSPCGERPRPVFDLRAKAGFQSTLPVWGATMKQLRSGTGGLFQSTLPVWGATFPENSTRYRANGISIHAPRVGSDP